MRSNTFDRLSFLSLFLVVVLLPLFCLPFTNIPIETGKGLLLVVGLMVSVVFWAIARFFDGKIVFPRSWLLVSGLGVVLVFLLSAIFSGNSHISLFGTMFDTGSFCFIACGFLLMLMSSIVFKSGKQAKTVLLGTILSSAIVLIFQSIHLFLPAALSLGILGGKTDNILGSWNTLGLFTGFSGLMYLLVIEFFPISKKEKILLMIFILLAVLLAACVNFALVWVLLGISSLIIFVYKVSMTLQRSQEGADENGKKDFPMVSFVVVVVALLFFASGSYISSIIPNHFQLLTTEVSPSFGATLDITKGVLTKNPFVGVGPNRFAQAWSMYKPAVINGTQFWDVSFDSGSGLLPTLAATTGGLGILALIVFFALFLYLGIKSVFSSIKNSANWEMMAFFVLSLYLFVSLFFYSTGAVIFLLALAFTGVFIGLSASSGGREVKVSFLNDHRKGFFSILVLILVVVFSLIATFKYVERFVSVSYFGKALSASTEPIAEKYIGKALSLYSNDLYWRAYSQIYLVKLNSLVGKGSALSDSDKTDLQTSFNQVVNGAQMAVAYNPRNYLNLQLLGSVYQAAGTLGVKDAYGKAVEAYQAASNLNPLNPGIKLAMANASFLDGKVAEAKEFAKTALSLKGDYVDALITLSQIAKSEGDKASALSYAQSALALSPDDKNLSQYVDSLNSPAPIPAPTPEPAPAPLPATNNPKK